LSKIELRLYCHPGFLFIYSATHEKAAKQLHAILRSLKTPGNTDRPTLLLLLATDHYSTPPPATLAASTNSYDRRAWVVEFVKEDFKRQ
jgi:hypothetical protein